MGGFHPNSRREVRRSKVLSIRFPVRAIDEPKIVL